MKNNTNTNETIETDITHNFGALYYPKSALVFYETDDYNPDGYVEHFDIDGNGHPVNAHPLTVREANRLAKSLMIHSRKEKDFLKPIGVMSENVLYIDSTENGKVIWLTKGKIRPMLFTEKLSIPNGSAEVPPLLWCANRQGMKIFALDSDERPKENTPLFHAPFFNVYESGSVCMGTVDINIKKSASLEEFMAQWEYYFFNSYFSHLVNSHNPIKGNCVNLWKGLIQNQGSFPKEVLVNSNLTLKNLL
ncbi:PRTRC system protein B [Chryseobacterium indologenes]|uniref:PRTRC system protein B n=1 Tax=Chryseobacterium indologenes TaxID=253 RepID=UPI000BFE4BA7|nr:PRTRC system protein B [Chryseobacterium indologenes]ATN07250.1 PRTRC system protein B [Chryseobacterium indologenes]AYY83999.1 PRTRC system protein B [Chryseobacterium indologenes]QIX80942.1 PRTRC system protein B [Chryseobacterium indologenes]UDQ54627.1 prokaryotic E2 ligase family D protein [Chryseobacterium indologenes]